MKADITSALLAGPQFPSRHESFLGSDDGFRRFLTGADSELEAETFSTGQPLAYLDSVPALSDTALDGPLASLMSVQESLSRALGSALLIAARPTDRAPSLSEAVQKLRDSLR